MSGKGWNVKINERGRLIGFHGLNFRLPYRCSLYGNLKSREWRRTYGRAGLRLNKVRSRANPISCALRRALGRWCDDSIQTGLVLLLELLPEFYLLFLVNNIQSFPLLALHVANHALLECLQPKKGGGGGDRSKTGAKRGEGSEFR